MPTNKDIKELIEARKARRAVPQVDPADVVARPEPEMVPPVQPAQPTESATRDVELSQTVMEEPPQLEVTKPAPTAPTPSPSTSLEVDDPRTQAPPQDDIYIPKTLKVKRHRDRQLRAEAYQPQHPDAGHR